MALLVGGSEQRDDNENTKNLAATEHIDSYTNGFSSSAPFKSFVVLRLQSLSLNH
jgi:hypothetical protein